MSIRQANSVITSVVNLPLCILLVNFVNFFVVIFRLGLVFLFTGFNFQYFGIYFHDNPSNRDQVMSIIPLKIDPEINPGQRK